jgi:hypothetical protein
MAGLKIALLTLWAPVRALAKAADERRFLWPLLLVVACGVLFAALAAPRLDLAGPAEEQLEKQPDYAKMTPHDREEKIGQAVKLGTVGLFASEAVLPGVMMLAAAFMLWLGFKVAGGKPGFGATVAVFANAMLPSAIKQLLTLPALLTRARLLSVQELAGLLPSSLAALAPEKLPLPKLALLGSVDLFALWSVALVAVGMAYVGKVSALRSTVVVAILWASFVLVFRFALPSLAAAGT